jgi:hypothetical protein
MKIIKEFCKAADVCVIRTDSYAHNLEHILNLCSEASRDFPELEPDMIQVVQYGGDRYARTFGIEFHPGKQPPASYTEIDKLENI